MQTETRPMVIGPTFPVRPVWVAGAFTMSYGGIWMHEFHRVPAMLGFTPEGLLSLLLPAVLIFLAWWRFPRHIAPITAMWALGLLHLLGACATVLPLAFLPFVPEQTVSHYLVHVVYAVAQIPLLLVAFGLARRRRQARERKPICDVPSFGRSFPADRIPGGRAAARGHEALLDPSGKPWLP